MVRILILTGTCGSGKTTVSKLLSVGIGWRRISEDELWKQYYGNNRGAFGSDEHRIKRQHIHKLVLEVILSIYKESIFIVIDATVHESPPEAYYEYSELFKNYKIEWHLCVLKPRLEIAIMRDSQRKDWIAGSERVEKLYEKFTGKVFSKEWFIDNSDETPEQTMKRIYELYAA